MIYLQPDHCLQSPEPGHSPKLNSVKMIELWCSVGHQLTTCVAPHARIWLGCQLVQCEELLRLSIFLEAKGR